MQDAKVKSKEASLFSNEAVLANLPANIQPPPGEVEPEVSLRASVGNYNNLSAVATEGLSSSCNAATGTLSSSTVEQNHRANADENDDGSHVANTLCDEEGRRVSRDDAVSTVIVARLDVGAAAPDGTAFISPTDDITCSEDSVQTDVEAVTQDSTFCLNIGSILAESFISNTHSAENIISTEATVGSPLAASEITASSDLRLRVSDSGIYSDLIFKLLKCLQITAQRYA